MNFEELVLSPMDRGNVLFDDENLKLWIRKKTRRPEKVLFDVAAVEAVVKGRGSFTRFLDRYEPIGVFVESVSDDRLGLFLLKRGYTKKGEGDLCSYYLPTGSRPLEKDLAETFQALNAYDPDPFAKDRV